MLSQMNTHGPTPLRYTLPLGVWTFCTSVVTLLASLGLTAWVVFFGVQGFLATDKGQTDLLSMLRFIGLTAAVGLPGLWMCLGYIQATWPDGRISRGRWFWGLSGGYHLAAMIMVHSVCRGSVVLKSGIEFPPIPFWMLSLAAAIVSIWLALGFWKSSAVVSNQP